MNLVAISRVKNEIDIIEAFVRHHSHYFDRLIIADNGSTDGTYEVLLALKEAGFPLVLMQEPIVGYDQSAHMSRLLQMAVEDGSADWIVPLDADEFIEPPEGTTLSEVIRAEPTEVLRAAWSNFAWSPEEDVTERNPVVRMRLRMPRSPAHLDKVLIPAGLVTPDAVLLQGNHALSVSGQSLPARRLDTISLCHYPIRSIAQYAAKIAVGYLQYAATPGWDRLSGFHYIDPFRVLARDGDEFAAAAAAHSRHYSLSNEWPQDGPPREAPLRYTGERLQFAASSKPILTNILFCAEAIAAEAARLGQTRSDARRANGIDGAAIAVRPAGAAARSRAAESQHVFQAFWAGGPLTPYEALCLKSFVTHGHGVDLYSFDPNLNVPDGVRVCDASAVSSPDSFFVYEDGFGKGSPSAFANLFRYKLLAQKGGWWIDTDVVCLTDDVPDLGEFFASEDAELINVAVMRFPPAHPLVLRCLEQARALGSSVRWGDTGPRLFTRLARERGLSGSALPSSTCYPVHYSDAADLLRPAKFEAVRDKIQSSLFVHLWNQMLVQKGVRKTLLPPRGSLLRQWADQHAVGGWTGEYDGELLERSLLLQHYCDMLTLEKEQMSATLKQERDSNQILLQERERLQAALYHSRWRVTAPLRRLSRFLKGETAVD